MYTYEIYIMHSYTVCEMGRWWFLRNGCLIMEHVLPPICNISFSNTVSFLFFVGFVLVFFFILFYFQNKSGAIICQCRRMCHVSSVLLKIDKNA